MTLEEMAKYVLETSSPMQARVTFDVDGEKQSVRVIVVPDDFDRFPVGGAVKTFNYGADQKEIK